MIEARIFTDTLDSARIVLTSQRATNKGSYKIIDDIYCSIDPSISLTNEFLRLRVLPENIWDDKEVVLAIKKTNIQSVGKNSDIPLKQQFDRKEDALNYYKKHLSTQYVKDFSFSRIGWQYVMGNGDVVDLEIIEDIFASIEFKAETSDGIKRLLSLFNVPINTVITGPSVVAVKRLLNR